MLWMQWLEWNCAILVITCHQYCVLCLLFWKGIRFIFMFSDFAVLYTFGWRCVFDINCIFILVNKWLFMTVIKVFLALARWSWTMIHQSRSCQTNLFPMPNCLVWHFDPCVQFMAIEIFLRKNGGKQWGVSGGYVILQHQVYSRLTYLISNFHCVLNVVSFLLGSSPASEFYMPMFRNTLSCLHRR